MSREGVLILQRRHPDPEVLDDLQRSNLPP